jgi:hypothetical protein
MKNDKERYSILFHDRARDAMLSLYREFRQATTALDRLRDENVFQQLQGRYASQLKHRLDSIALEMLETGKRDAGCSEWSHSLGRVIQEYVREFGQKIRSL